MREHPLGPIADRIPSSGIFTNFRSGLSTSVLGILAVFFAINVLYVVKYGARAGISPAIGIPAYALAFLVQCAAAFVIATWIGQGPRPRLYLSLLLAVYTVAAGVVYLKIDPMGLSIDRWSALDYFLDALFKGVFPWSVETHLGSRISGFPGLFVLAMPFYLAGDVGLLQFAALIALVVLAWVRLRDASRPAFLLILLVGTPIFSYQLFCRSDLLGNMAVAAWLLHWGERSGAARGFRIVLWGFAWGLMLSTRAILIVPLIIAAFPLLRGRGFKAHAGFGLAVTLAFLATFLPFYLWNPELFREYNPWSVQSGYASRPVLAAVLLSSIWIGWKHRAAPSLFRDTGWILMVTVTGCWILRSIDVGWGDAFWRHYFDVTYFFLGVPFLLIALGERLPANFGKSAR